MDESAACFACGEGGAERKGGCGNARAGREYDQQMGPPGGMPKLGGHTLMHLVLKGQPSE